jgi:serine/threonine protein kinase
MSLEQTERRTRPEPTTTVVEFVPRSFVTICGDFPEYAIELVLRFPHSKWHVKVSFRGAIQLPRTQRKEHLQQLCHIIDFTNVSLLQDTVTEIILSRQQDSTAKPLPVRDGNQCIWFHLREDPLRVYYPVISSSATWLDISEIQKVREISASVHEVRVRGNEQPYIFQHLDRLLYEPNDTVVLQHELKNLELLGETEVTVRLITIVASINPYYTIDTETSKEVVLRGLLLEYHPNGTLDNLLQSSDPQRFRRPCRKWALQIARGVDKLHSVELTHMDLKLSMGKYSVEPVTK